METKHVSVLPEETLEGLDVQPSDVVVDGTLGGGGHAAMILEQLNSSGVLIGIDASANALDRVRARLGETDASVHFVESNFRHIDSILNDLSIERIDKVLLDLGLSADQLELSNKGFTFQENQPLVMTYEDTPKEETLTAEHILNEWEAESIQTILESYGEEQFAYKIAQGIAEYRQRESIKTTDQLNEIIKRATPNWYHHKKMHPSTKAMQALRIATNDELQALEEALDASVNRLSGGGRIAVISFHSLEDRIVKHLFKRLVEEGKGESLTKKPITPSEEELKDNPRARSAKLRIFIRNH